MFTFLITLILIVSGLLILAVLLQNSKKEGLGNPLSDSGAAQLIGVKKTSDLLEQLTWGLIVTLFVLTLATSFVLNKTTDVPLSPNVERAQEQGALPTAAPQETQDSQPTSPADKEEQKK